jgi:hypothetical protein
LVEVFRFFLCRDLSVIFPNPRATLVQISLVPRIVFLTLGFAFCRSFGPGSGLPDTYANVLDTYSETYCSTKWQRTFVCILFEVWVKDKPANSPDQEDGTSYPLRRMRDPMIAILVIFLL